MDRYDPGQRAAGGALVGARAGAATGGLACGGRGALLGGLIGGTAGAVTGAATTAAPLPAARLSAAARESLLIREQSDRGANRRRPGSEQAPEGREGSKDFG